MAGASGDQLAARAALACLRTDGLGAVHSSSIWSATMLGACEAAHVLGDADAAGEAYELLAPYADLPVMASLGVACYGSAHRPLGLAAATVGDLDRAVDHLERAVVAELAVGGGPWHAMALAALADVLDQRATAGDGATASDGKRAADLRRAAIDEAHRLGMAGRADEWEGAGSGRRSTASPAGATVASGWSNVASAWRPCRTASAWSTWSA